MNKKFLYFDTETTGLTDKHGLVQVAGIIVIDGIERETFNIKCRPFESDLIDEKALTIIGKTKEEIKKWQEPGLAIKELTSICGKYLKRGESFALIAHNLSFDFQVLITWFNKNNLKFGKYFSFYDGLCTFRVVQALKMIGKFPETKNNKLGTLCSAVNIKLENAHDALNDVIATRKLCRYVAKKLVKLEDA